jgi:hypothetical protein
MRNVAALNQFYKKPIILISSRNKINLREDNRFERFFSNMMVDETKSNIIKVWFE